jgi:hypothetical protein
MSKNLSGNASTARSPSQSKGELKPRRHPLFGRMKGMITVMPDTDLTLPPDPDWAKIAQAKQPKPKRQNEL